MYVCVVVLIVAATVVAASIMISLIVVTLIIDLSICAAFNESAATVKSCSNPVVVVSTVSVMFIAPMMLGFHGNISVGFCFLLELGEDLASIVGAVSPAVGFRRFGSCE